jgi:biopolymer transport protein ExbB/TolQ
MRALSDNDALAVDGSYSLIRFIIWGIPILGLLGTVLGITGAVTGLTPEILERELSKVTGGLALAFDTTALALCLTMVLMFVQYVVERSEQATLEAVDAYIDTHLAHRFERSAAEGSSIVPLLQQQTQHILQTMERVVQRQAEIWADTIDRADQHWAEQTDRQLQQFGHTLETAMDGALVKHTQRIRELQEALNWVTEKMAAQVNALAQLQENDGHLARTQDLLQKNLATLASSNTFQEAVQSLTAAIHLLTARTGGAQAATLPIRQTKAA